MRSKLNHPFFFVLGSVQLITYTITDGCYMTWDLVKYFITPLSNTSFFLSIPASILAFCDPVTLYISSYSRYSFLVLFDYMHKVRFAIQVVWQPNASRSSRLSFSYSIEVEADTASTCLRNDLQSESRVVHSLFVGSLDSRR